MKLIALLVIIIAVIILAWYFWPDEDQIRGAISTGQPINKIVERWKIAPDEITVGEEETFVLLVQDNNPMNTPQLTNIEGRHYVFTVGPSANISIVSVTPAATAPNSGITDKDGQITIVIKADSLPDADESTDESTGSLVGIPPVDTNVKVEASFSVIE